MFRTLQQYLCRLALDVRDYVYARKLTWHDIPGTGMKMLGGNWMVAGASHETREVNLFRSALAHADAVVDVGANSGLFSLLAADMGKPCFAFEPLPGNLRYLYENRIANEVADGVEVYPLAASENVGLARFYGRGQGASLLAGWAGQRKFDYQVVPTNRLDNILGKRLKGSRVFLKMDVEGAELSVLKGAGGLLQDCTTVLLEHSLAKNHPGGLNPKFMELFELMWNAGFTAQVADAERTPVDKSLVEGWISTRSNDLGTENFIFSRA